MISVEMREKIIFWEIHNLTRLSQLHYAFKLQFPATHCSVTFLFNWFNDSQTCARPTATKKNQNIRNRQNFQFWTIFLKTFWGWMPRRRDAPGPSAAVDRSSVETVGRRREFVDRLIDGSIDGSMNSRRRRTTTDTTRSRFDCSTT